MKFLKMILLIVLVSALVFIGGCSVYHKGETAMGFLKDVNHSSEGSSSMSIASKRPARD